MAIGASGGDVQRLFVRRGLTLTGDRPRRRRRRGRWRDAPDRGAAVRRQPVRSDHLRRGRRSASDGGAAGHVAPGAAGVAGGSGHRARARSSAPYNRSDGHAAPNRGMACLVGVVLTRTPRGRAAAAPARAALSPAGSGPARSARPRSVAAARSHHGRARHRRRVEGRGRWRRQRVVHHPPGAPRRAAGRDLRRGRPAGDAQCHLAACAA